MLIGFIWSSSTDKKRYKYSVLNIFDQILLIWGTCIIAEVCFLMKAISCRNYGDLYKLLNYYNHLYRYFSIDVVYIDVFYIFIFIV